MFSDKMLNSDMKSHLAPSSSSGQISSKPRVPSASTASLKTAATKSTTTKQGSSARPASARPAKQFYYYPKNDNSVYFSGMGPNANETAQGRPINVRSSSSKVEFQEWDQRSQQFKKKKRQSSTATYERKMTLPGRYMQQAKDNAIRRRHQLIARQGELLEKEHLYDCSLSSKLAANRAMDENRKLKSQLSMAHQKLKVKDNLMSDSLNCTFIACPHSQHSKAPNMNLIFKLRKKVIELRDLVALQEVEIINM